ncbi:hypothetical protein [Vibrio splendidus]|uniref:hypothetical protein n=1 Tax=Vibrio splendidus TaxID=29497 RepID=UPI0021B31F96|nr:hypothetical protein [Vibrio splendidus]UXA00787.1 hypothetical protein IM698_19435 [Vibrio splendidus]
MNRKPLMKTVQWLLASYLLASIIASPSIAFAANCAGVWDITQLSNAPIEFDKSGYANIRFELKKIRSKSEQCILKSVRLKVLDRPKASHIYFINQNQTMLSYDPKEREYLLNSQHNRPVRFSLVDPKAKISYAAKYAVPLLVKLQFENDQILTLSANANYKVKSFVSLDWSGRGNSFHKTASGYRWALGILSNNKHYQTDFVISSNSRTELWVKPKYRKLINAQHPESVIEYKLTVDGTEVSQSHQMIPISRYARGKHNIPLDLRITGNTNLSRAGHYKEELQVQVKAIDPIF